MQFETRLNEIETGDWTAGVIGLGYVGLPLVITVWRAGLKVVGFDVSSSVVGSLNEGISHIDDVSTEDLRGALSDGVRFTNDSTQLSEADVVFICVPSPLGSNRQPDLSYVSAAADTVRATARQGQVICLESTSYPGTTEDFLLPALDDAGLKIDVDAYLAFSPERVSPGDNLKTHEIPKVVGGVSDASTSIAAAAYRRLVAQVHPVSSARAAEMTKLVENIYRSVNIGLINEIAQLAHELKIDIWEVIEAASTKPFGFHAFYPGPGVGGHCIPLDPQYLAWRAREANFSTRFIDVADEINRGMPRYVTRRIGETLNDIGLPVLGARVLGVGVTYKPNISDDRESASIEVLRELAKRGAEVSVLDPHVSTERLSSLGFTAIANQDDRDEFTIAVVLTDHDSIDYDLLARQVPLVFDTRGTYRKRGLSANNVITL